MGLEAGAGGVMAAQGHIASWWQSSHFNLD